MELLLNLAWLLLALPAYWLWRGSRSAQAEHKFTSLQCLLALGCVLVILFPVISATDDLIAMRTEMEESPISKRSIRHVSSDKSVSNTRLQASPALLGTAPAFVNAAEHGDLILNSCVFPPSVSAVLHTGRSPPDSLA